MLSWDKLSVCLKINFNYAALHFTWVCWWLQCMISHGWIQNLRVKWDVVFLAPLRYKYVFNLNYWKWTDSKRMNFEECWGIYSNLLIPKVIQTWNFILPKQARFDFFKSLIILTFFLKRFKFSARLTCLCLRAATDDN